jgi:cholesterol transport system auxiliary component
MPLNCRTLISGLLSAVLLGACAASPKPRSARYDLGLPGAPAARIPVSAVESSAASWLAGTDMQYRLLYADPQRRLAYAEAQWAAPPAELLGQTLRRQADGTGNCRLRVMLDELEQDFDTPERSTVRLDVRTRLLPARGELAIAHHSFTVREPATAVTGNPGAAAGAAATARAIDRLSTEIDTWLKGLPPASLQRCREP